MGSPSADGRRYRGAALAERQEERRAKLIEAGIELFGTSGYRSSTVEKICATAGLTKRYFYESFGGSEELLLACYTEATERLRAAVRDGAGRATDLGSATTGALGAFFAAIEDDPRIGRITFHEILGVSPKVDRAYRATTLAFVDTLIELTAPFVGPAADPAQVRLVATGLVGAILMIAQQWMLSDFTDPADQVVATAALILDTLVLRLGS